MSDDDLLDPNEIEALLSAAGGDDPPVAVPEPAAPAPSAASVAQEASTNNLLDQAEADLASAIAMDGKGVATREDLSNAQNFAFQSLGNHQIDPKRKMELEALQDVDLDLRIELGRTELLIEDVLSLKSGSVVSLDKLAGDPVDIIVNGRLVARGEVLVLNDNFCIRVAEILAPDF